MNRSQRFKNNTAAFTLIELIVVIAIIAVLAAIIAPNAFKAIEKAKISRSCADLKTIKAACFSYYSDTGQWPITDTALHANVDTALRNTDLLNNIRNLSGWDGPYLESDPMTGWGSVYWLTSWDMRGNGAPYDLGIVLTSNRYTDLSDLANPVPVTALTKIDASMDDGDLSTGNFCRVSAFGNNEGVLVYHWGE